MTREEAIKIVYGISGTKAQHEALEFLIPELHESEDERIRKQLINICNEWLDGGHSARPCLNDVRWLKNLLEKQEQKPVEAKIDNPNIQNIIKSFVDSMSPDESLTGIEHDLALYTQVLAHYKAIKSDVQYNNALKGFAIAVKESLNEQKEQKSTNPNLTTWHRDVVYSAMCDKNLDEGLRCNLEVVYKTIKEIVDRTPVVEEQKPDIALIQHIQQSWYMEGYNDRKFSKEPMWLIKTGKGGPKYEVNPKYGQPLADEQKPTWSEEDEKRIKQLIYDTEHIRAEYEKRKKELGENFNDKLIKDCDAQIAWLKDLRPSWKPSEEQMDELYNTFYTHSVGAKSRDVLESLYEQLKKL